MDSSLLVIAPNVQHALNTGKPVVALESTIIAHGMPYPDNVSTAKLVEDTVRSYGAEPATIAVLKGKIHIGMSDDEILSIADNPNVMKLSRKDLAYAVSTGATGATTVATTMICASLAGIKVFATGGIGGVHRHAETTMDISADLQELANTQVAVVTAGAKSILDLGLTLEYLETYGVPVIGYETLDFPAFFTRSSGFGLEMKADSPEQLATIIHTHWALGLRSGVVVANPIPEGIGMDRMYIEGQIDKALRKATKAGISGKNLTPFLLSEIKKATDGESLKANIGLVLNNAQLAAQLAVGLSSMKS